VYGWLNVHASGGPVMLAQAYKSLDSFGIDRPLLIAVTVLTQYGSSSIKAQLV